MPKFNIEIQPPLGGVKRKAAFQKQEPFTAYDMMNFWPVDCRTGREVLATRPGLEPVDTPGGSIVTMLAPINAYSTLGPFESMIASFGGNIYYWNGTGWTAATGAQADEIETDRSVHAVPFLESVYISKEGAKPIRFNYTTGEAVTLSESAGTAPSDCRMFQVFQNVLWAAGDQDQPHILFGSKTGDATDWNYGQNNTGSAFFTGTDEYEGLFNGPITAIAAHTSDTMVVSTLGQMMAMRGHPLRGGIFEAIDSEQFILGQGAWCVAPSGVMFMLTPMGMAALAPEVGAVPALISRTKIPSDLVGLKYNYANPTVQMIYDTRWNAIHITVRGNNEQAWTYFIDSGAFCPAEFAGYPFAMMEFKPFITNSTSGVLFGGEAYGGLALLDSFGTESFPSSCTIGPFPISQDPMHKSRIDKMRVIFGRDTPDDEVNGVIRVCTGTDGQDAVNRLLISDRSTTYEQNLSTLGGNDGTLYPSVSGHAAAVQIALLEGNLSVETMQAELSATGKNRIRRSAQLPVNGEPTDFADPSNDFDATIWRGYNEATPDAPSCNLPGFTHFVDLSELPVAWWAETTLDGRDIRPTDENNNPLPFDLVNFDRENLTGFLALKMDQFTDPKAVRLWVGNPTVGVLGASDEFGQYNAYDSNWKAFYPSGAGNDRTRNLNHLTMSGITDTADEAGPIGNLATDYEGQTNWYGSATASVPTGEPVTLVCAARRNNSGTAERFALGLYNTGSTDRLDLCPGIQSSNVRTRMRSGVLGTNETADTATGAAAAETWFHHAGTATSDTLRAAYLSGGGKVTDTDEVAPTLDCIVVGKGERPGLSSSSFQGFLSLVQVHNTARSDCWIDYQAQMMDQDDFWNGWGDFIEVNDPIEDIPLSSACPSGIVAVSETGTWSGYAEATPDATISEYESNWSHFIDLSDMPADWWTAVSATGVDIRATDSFDRFLPLDLIEFDKDAKTGFAVVRMTQTQTPLSIRLWVGNASAVTVPACAAYGQYFAYDEHWIGFWPEGGGDDRTQYQHDLTASRNTTAISVPDFGAATGPIGNTATTYDGVGQYGICDTLAAAKSSPQTPLTLVSFAKHSGNFDPDYGIGNDDIEFNAQVSLSMFNTNPVSSIVLDHTNGTTRCRIGARGEDLRLGSTKTDALTDLDTWRCYVGSARNSVKREIYVDGGNDDPFTANDIPAPLHNLSKIAIGMVYNGVRNTSFFAGDLSLVSLHKTIRSQEWAEYHYKMLNQTTFWNGWTWTSESSTLPQS